MTAGLEAATARARGLATHLIPGPALSSLCESSSLEQLVRALESWLPGAPPERPVSPRDIEAWSRTAAGALLRTLTRWLQLRGRAADVLLADEEQRAVRRIVRGIVTGQPPAWRLQDLIPTPALPTRALETLAQQTTLALAAAALAAWRSPYADAVANMARQARADLFQIDLAVFKAYVEHSKRIAHPAGTEFRQHLRNVIDTENLLAALLIAERPQDVAAETIFLEGGQNLPRAVFQSAAHAGGVDAALLTLRAGATGWLASALQAPGWSTAPEAKLLRAWIDHYGRLSRQQPLGLWPPVLFLLRLRAQLSDLRRISWGIALNAPPSLVRAQLVAA